MSNKTKCVINFTQRITSIFGSIERVKVICIPYNLRNFVLVLNTLIFIISIATSNVGEASNIDCLSKLLEKQYSSLNESPEIKFMPGTYWFKDDSTVLEEPPHDIKYSPKESVFYNHSVIYFFNLKDSKEYVQYRAGISDSVIWYGPINVSPDVMMCLDLMNNVN